LFAILLIALFMTPRSAKAWDWWDWAQEFSGPGPFHTRKPNLMFDLCLDDAQKFKPQEKTDRNGRTYIEQVPDGDEVTAKDGTKVFVPKTDRWLRDFDVRPDNDKDGRKIGGVPVCYFADFRFFQNREDDNFFQGRDEDHFGLASVKLDVYEFGVSARLHHAISLGFGGGAMRISTAGHTAWQGVITGPRLIIKPLLIYGSPEFWRRDKHTRVLHLILGSVKYYVKEDIVLGHLTGADFGLSEGSPKFKFDVDGDRQWSTGFIVDLTDFVVTAIRGS
jgi:hypothetical protein